MTIRNLGKILSLSLAFVLTLPLQAHAQVADVGGMMNQIIGSLSSIPTVFAGVSYIMGVYFSAEGIFKFKDHVDEVSSNGRPSTPLSAGVKRFLAGGMFLGLPYMTKAVKGTLVGTGGTSLGYSSVHGCGPCTGADKMVYDFISNISGPSTFLISAFGYIAAIIFLISGIQRLTRTSQEGPRGPTGLGTIMTFIVAGALFSFGELAGAFSSSLFGSSQTSLYSNIGSNVITDASSKAQVEPIIDSVMIFVALVGFIAFMRGWFVLKAYADGQQQASVAQGMTFLLGGTMAINLGHLINFVQNTVGLDAANGITFS